MRGYTTTDVAELLDVSAARVRAFARAGFLSPRKGLRGEYRFSFPDIILLRAAKELTDARIHPRKVWRALRALREQLPAGQSLTGMRISAEGDHVVVREKDLSWMPESGQATLDFSVSDLARRVTPLVRDRATAAKAAPGVGSDEWYNIGIDFEVLGALTDAKAAYSQAIELDADNADAYVNLGRLLHGDNELERARAQYEKALKLVPDSAIAAFNLGVVLEDLSRPAEAVRAYLCALQADPGLADAHYNIAYLYERDGDTSGALRHLARYKALSRKK